MAFDISQGFKRPVTISFTKADGTPGTVDGIPVWESSDPTVLSVVAAADGLSGEVTWAGVGQAVLTIRADGDLGTGVFPIVLSETFNLLAPLGAVGGALGVGEPIPA